MSGLHIFITWTLPRIMSKNSYNSQPSTVFANSSAPFNTALQFDSAYYSHIQRQMLIKQIHLPQHNLQHFYQH